MGAAAVPVAAIGLGAQIVGGLMQADEQEEQARQQAAAMRQNAYLARLAAADAVQRGQADAGMVRMQASRIMGEQRVAAAASGVDGSVGTPAALAAESRMFAELDARTLQSNAAREAWGHRMQAQQLERAAAQVEKAGERAAWGTILGTGGRAAAGAYGMGLNHGWWGAGT